MANRRRTDLAAAALVKVMAEMGFDRSIIERASGLPKGTVADIVCSRGIWKDPPKADLYNITRERVTEIITTLADSLALTAIKKIEEMISKGDYWQNLSLLDVLLKAGRL